MLRQQLNDGAAAIGVPLIPDQLDALLAYLDQLVRWNQTYNLTAVRGPADMIDRHLVDSLSVLAHINKLFGTKPIHLMDIGTGAGLPGIPLALVRSSTALTLVETSGKKAAFLRQCQIALGLKDMEVCQSRVENLNPESLALGSPDLLISRAFRPIGEFLELAAPFVSSSTVILAMKGPALEDELAQLTKRIKQKKVSKHLLSVLDTHIMSIETISLAESDATRQVAIFSAAPQAGLNRPAAFLQE